MEPNPEALRVVSVSTFPQRPNETWVPADQKVLEENGWGVNGYKWMKLEPRGPIRHAKFYFYHFNETECRRFIDLMNDKKLKIGYPGYFYKLPFFIKETPRL